MNRFAKNRRQTRVRRTPAWLRFASVPVIAFVFLWILHLLVFDVRPVQGASMEPTLHGGEWVLIAKPAYALREPRYGELAVCTPAVSSDAWIKRILGLPGDILRAENGQLYRNDEAVYEPYLSEDTPAFSAIKSWEGEYLLLGDHRGNSSDSRLSIVGAIPREQLRGQALLVIWPPKAWRSL